MAMGLPSKVVTASNICLKDKNEKVFNTTKNFSSFKNDFSNLLHNLVSKPPLSLNIFNEYKIATFYDNNVVSKDLNFQLSKRDISKKILSRLF